MLTGLSLHNDYHNSDPRPPFSKALHSYSLFKIVYLSRTRILATYIDTENSDIFRTSILTRRNPGLPYVAIANYLRVCFRAIHEQSSVLVSILSLFKSVGHRRITAFYEAVALTKLS